jgi:phage gpG-like protein
MRADTVLLRLRSAQSHAEAPCDTLTALELDRLKSEFASFMLSLAILSRQSFRTRLDTQDGAITNESLGFRYTVPHGSSDWRSIEVATEGLSLSINGHTVALDSLLDRTAAFSLVGANFRFAAFLRFEGLQSFVDDATVHLSSALPVDRPLLSPAAAEVLAREMQVAIHTIGSVWTELGRGVLRALPLVIPRSRAAGTAVANPVGTQLFGAVHTSHAGSPLAAAVSLVSAASQQIAFALLADSSQFPGTAAPAGFTGQSNRPSFTGWPLQHLIGRAIGADAALCFLARAEEHLGRDYRWGHLRTTVISEANVVLTDPHVQGMLTDAEQSFFADFRHRLYVHVSNT